MRLEQIKNDHMLVELQLVKSKNILRESCEGLTLEQKSVVESVYRHFLPLIEASLNPDDITQLFKSIEEHPKNKTAVGKAAGAAATAGKSSAEVAKKANEILNQTGKWIQDTKPVQAFDQKFNDLKTQIANKLGGEDSKIVQQVQKLGELAKANPGKTAVVIGVLTVLASLAGGPLGGLIAGQVLRGTTELVKGEKLSTAIGKGAKMATIGALAGMTFNAIGDSVVSNISNAGEDDLENMIKSFDQANAEQAMSNIPAEYQPLLSELEGARNYKITGHINNFRYNYNVILTTDLVEQYRQLEQAMRDAARQSGSSFSEESMAAAAKYHDFMVSVQNDPAQTTYRQALAAIEQAKSDAKILSVDQLNQLTAEMDNLDEKVEAWSNASPAIAAAVQGAAQQADTFKKQATSVKNLKPEQQESHIYKQHRSLSEGQVYLLFKRIDIAQRYLVEQGLVSRVKGAAGEIGQKIKQAGKRVANKVTADQLTKAWQAAGSPSEPDQLYQFLKDQGVSTDIIKPVYDTMKLPVPDDAAPSDNAAGTGQNQTGDPTSANDQAAGTTVTGQNQTGDPTSADTTQASTKEKPTVTLNDVKAKLVYIRTRNKQALLNYLKTELGIA